MVDTPFRLYTDGACRGNPGLGGIGVVFKDEQGSVKPLILLVKKICITIWL